MSTEVTVNREPRQAASAPGTPLLYVLRDEFGLTAAKFGCGSGHCGACTVAVDGKPVQSCSTPLGSVAGAGVTTLEGIGASDGSLHPVQTVFERHGAIQCGYCIPGILMTLHSRLTQAAPPTYRQVVDELAERHLCRCGTHARILAAVRELFPGTTP